MKTKRRKVEYVGIVVDSKNHDLISLCKEAANFGRSVPKGAKIDWMLVSPKEFSDIRKTKGIKKLALMLWFRKRTVLSSRDKSGRHVVALHSF